MYILRYLQYNIYHSYSYNTHSNIYIYNLIQVDDDCIIIIKWSTIYEVKLHKTYYHEHSTAHNCPPLTEGKGRPGQA